MLLETFAGLLTPRLLQGAFRLGAAVHKAGGRRFLLGLLPLGPLARGTEIDEVAHERFGGNQLYSSAVLALVWD